MPVRLTEGLVRRHQQDVWRFLRFLGASPALADDLTQEAFLAVAVDEPEDRGEAATGAWLRSAARHRFLRHCRDGRRLPRLRSGLDGIAEAELERIWAERIAPQRDRRVSALACCLEELTPRARLALDLRYGAELGRDALATRLGMAPEGVKTLLRRTRDALAACIRRQLGKEEE